MAFNEKQAAMNLEQVKAEQHKKRQQGIKAGFKMAECLIADEAIAKFFYANGIPFEVARASGGDSLYRDMVRAIQATPAGYIPPNNNKIAGPLLDSTYEHMWADINLRDADGDLAKPRSGSNTSITRLPSARLPPHLDYFLEARYSDLARLPQSGIRK